MRVPKRIETPRLEIRPFAVDDAEAFVAFMTDEETTTEFMFHPEQKTSDGARGFFENILASYATETPCFVCAIALADRPGFVGMCGISNLPADGAFECFVCLAPESRGVGYATEAVRALIAHCFEVDSVETFRTYISPANPRSIAIARRLGMRHSGRGRHPLHGEDSEVYALSRPQREERV